MTKSLIETTVKESNGMSLQADIYYSNEDDGFSVTYQVNGDAVKTESYPGKSVYFVESAVENWFNGIKKLNG